jgi:hypothetical protein
MSSQITVTSTLINTAYPIAGQSNDTQGFRNNFTYIQLALTTASNEITALQSTIDSLQSTTLVYKDGSIQGSNVTLTGNLNASNVYASGIIGTTTTIFVGDGSKLTNLPQPNLSNLSNINVPQGSVNAQTVNASGNITGQYFIGDGSQLTNVKAGLATAVGVLNTLTVAGNATIININSTGTIYANSLTLSGAFLVNNVSASAITANIIQASTFIGDGSQLTNIEFPTSISVDYIDVPSGTLTITDVKSIKVVNTTTILGSLTNWAGGSSSISTDGTFTVTLSTITNVAFIGTGTNQYNSFKLWSEDIFHTINTVTSTGSVVSITTTPFDITSAKSAGVNVNSTITFYKTTSPVVATYVPTAPSTSKGQPGDKQGMLFGDGTSIYVCTADYTTGSVDIWTKSAVVTQPW